MGLYGLARGLSNWSKSRRGQRKGKRVGFPKFKSKSSVESFAYSTGFTAPTAGDPYGLKLPRIGRVHCMENVYKRLTGARLIRITVSRRAGCWYASLTVERESTAPESAPKLGAVGVDLGVKHLATLSDGTVIPNPRALGTRLKALRKAQQSLSRKVEGSARREKAKERVARLHARVADVRADAINKATTMIARRYSVVCIEDLNVAGMVKNRHLARSVSDAALGEFRRQLEYKNARNSGGEARFYHTETVTEGSKVKRRRVWDDFGTLTGGHDAGGNQYVMYKLSDSFTMDSLRELLTKFVDGLNKAAGFEACDLVLPDDETECAQIVYA